MCVYANTHTFILYTSSSFPFLPAEIPGFVLSTRPSEVYHLSTISSVDLIVPDLGKILTILIGIGICLSNMP